MPNPNAINHNPEAQESQTPSGFDALSQAPSFEDHMAKLEQDQKKVEYSTSGELNKNFSETVSSLGLSAEFTSHPAFDSLLNTQRHNTLQWALSLGRDKIPVVIKNDQISFEWVHSDSSDRHEYKNLFQAVSPTELLVRQVEHREQHPSGNYIDEITIAETTYSLNQYGQLKVAENRGNSSNVIDRFNHESSLDNFQTATRRIFDTDGREIRREIRDYHHEEPSPSAAVTDAFMTSPLGYPARRMSDGFTRRTVIERTGAETAHVFVEEKDRGVSKHYSADEQLNGEHGYREMILSGGHDRSTH